MIINKILAKVNTTKKILILIQGNYAGIIPQLRFMDKLLGRRYCIDVKLSLENKKMEKNCININTPDCKRYRPNGDISNDPLSHHILLQKNEHTFDMFKIPILEDYKNIKNISHDDIINDNYDFYILLKNGVCFLKFPSLGQNEYYWNEYIGVSTQKSEFIKYLNNNFGTTQSNIFSRQEIYLFRFISDNNFMGISNEFYNWTQIYSLVCKPNLLFGGNYFYDMCYGSNKNGNKVHLLFVGMMRGFPDCVKMFYENIIQCNNTEIHVLTATETESITGYALDEEFVKQSLGNLLKSFHVCDKNDEAEFKKEADIINNRILSVTEIRSGFNILSEIRTKRMLNELNAEDTDTVLIIRPDTLCLDKIDLSSKKFNDMEIIQARMPQFIYASNFKTAKFYYNEFLNNYGTLIGPSFSIGLMETIRSKPNIKNIKDDISLIHECKHEWYCLDFQHIYHIVKNNLDCDFRWDFLIKRKDVLQNNFHCCEDKKNPYFKLNDFL